MHADDRIAVHTWASRPEFCRYQPWGPNTPEASRAFADNAAAAWTQTPQTRFPYIAKHGGLPIGTGDLWIRNRDHRQGEITYGLHPDLWGRGLGTLIGHELLAIGFAQLGLHRIYATCDPRNVGSARVLRKLGMTLRQRIIQLDRLGRFGLLSGKRLGISQPASFTHPAIAISQCSMRPGVGGIFVNSLLQITDGVFRISLVQKVNALQV